MSDREILDKLQDQFGFDQFMVIGIIPGKREDGTDDQMHVMSNGALDQMQALWIIFEAMGFLLSKMDDEDQLVH